MTEHPALGPDNLAHLDFTPTCAITTNGTPCERPARWIANIHMHAVDMPRVALCDHHRAGFYTLEAQIHPGRVNRCSVCHQSINPGDFIRNQEAM